MKKPVLFGLSVFILALTLTGCASQIPQSVRGDGSELTTFEQVRAAPEATLGEQVRWGGIIAEVRNRENNSEIEVVGFALRSFGRPQSNDETYGRFRVVVDGFADPEVYAKGRMITVLGAYTETEAGMIGEYVYEFPVVQASGVELWREEAPRVDDWRYDIYSPRYRNYLYGVGPYRVHPYHYYPYHYFPHGGVNQDGGRPNRGDNQRPPSQQPSEPPRQRSEPRQPPVDRAERLIIE
ncbi:starvation-inducible protein [Aliidiomarina shirensis]|uniref:Starvation-inducible protein n=1 Tax=Aliidiomarina shirensis TaxID=1048642 RepID=A0A432WTY4_9GAMM|nr:Slp family lipoprotein [Aliidiomarina shirensis]RUO37225.1 starvation-inducible protein [Aliidiomarina shirensis]